MAYNGQRGPNVSEFIANLNTIPTAQEMAQSQQQEEFNLTDDLAMFTNTQFFDFDLGHNTELEQQNFAFETQVAAASAAPTPSAKGIDFLPGDFSFPDFSAYPQNVFPANGNTIQTNNVYPPSSSTSSPTSGLPSHAGDKRKSDSMADAHFADGQFSNGGFEDSSRAAAEEDKRRRNTAASARFRVKKKQREQALEKSAKEMSDKMSALENRINQLETENKWLKNLVMEKNENKDDIAELWKKYSAEASERKGATRKDGVGTLKAE